jgi:hypothetical protein
MIEQDRQEVNGGIVVPFYQSLEELEMQKMISMALYLRGKAVKADLTEPLVAEPRRMEQLFVLVRLVKGQELIFLKRKMHHQKRFIIHLQKQRKTNND